MITNPNNTQKFVFPNQSANSFYIPQQGSYGQTFAPISVGKPAAPKGSIFANKAKGSVTGIVRPVMAQKNSSTRVRPE